jgi:diacylglycerol kinase (ATP)
LASPASSQPVVAQPPRLRRVVRSFGYAFEGIACMVRTQPNFLVHLVAAAVALVLGLLLGLAPVEMALIVLMIALVFILECLNTALESVCDVASPGYHPLVKRAKDVAASAVLIAAVAAVAIAALLFIPHLAAWFK